MNRRSSLPSTEDEKNRCDACGAIAKWRCAGCRGALYCSYECQKKAWSSHRKTCRKIFPDEDDVEFEPSGSSSEEEPDETESADAEMIGVKKRDPKKREPVESEPKSKRTKKRKREEGDEKKIVLKSRDALPVSATGAIAGEIIYGTNPNQVQGVRIKVVQGYVARGHIFEEVPSKDELRPVGDDEIVAWTARLWKKPISEMQARLDMIQKLDVPNHMPIGLDREFGGTEIAKFQLLDPGMLLTVVKDKVIAGGVDEKEYIDKVNELLTPGKTFGAKEFFEIIRIPGKDKPLLTLHSSWYTVEPPIVEMAPIVVDVLGGKSFSSGDLASGMRKERPDEKIYTLVVIGGANVSVIAPTGPPTRIGTERVLQIAGAECGSPDQVAIAHAEFFAGATDGQARAALQKVLRFGAPKVDMTTLCVENRSISSKAFACAALAKLFASAGTFNPDLGLFNRGCTSALKRLAVILFEDVWVPNAPTASLLSAALLAQKVSEWNPSEEVIAMAMRVCCAACDSPFVLARHPGGTWPENTDQGPPTVNRGRGVANSKYKTVEKFDVAAEGDLPSAAHLRSASYLLSAVGSFAGDESMVERFATMAGAASGNRLKLTKMGAIGPKTMPVEHVVDQHAYAQVGHLMHGKANFAEKFHALFDPYVGVTGVDPRRFGPGVDFSDYETRPSVAKFRRAQRAVLILTHAKDSCIKSRMSSKKNPLVVHDEKSKEALVLERSVPLGTLAGAVGPIRVPRSKKIKRDLLVVLGVDDPSDVVVMLNPTRDIKGGKASSTKEKRPSSSSPEPSDESASVRDEAMSLYSSVTDDEVAAAKEYAFSQKFKLTCPEVPEWHEKIATRDSATGTWTIDGVEYDSFRRRLELSDEKMHLSNDVDIVRLAKYPVALAEYARMARLGSPRNAKGASPDGTAHATFLSLCEKTQKKSLLRVLSLCRNQYERIDFPLPGRDGGQASDDLAAYPQDAGAYRFMLAASILFPSGLVASETKAAAFDIRSPVFAKWMIRKLTDYVRTRGAAAAEEEDEPSADKWNIGPSEMEPSEYQIDAVEEMVANFKRGVSGNFLFMPPGTGKTLVAMQFVRRVLSEMLGSSPPKYVIWVTPSSTIKTFSAFKEVRKTGALDVTFLETAKTYQTDEYKRALEKATDRVVAAEDVVSRPVPYAVNVVNMDRMRSLGDVLAPIAHETVLVVDEVDLFYAESLRTSSTLDVARLCPAVMLLTGTPFRSTKDANMRNWLALCVDFPVTQKNWLVAASRMVAKSVDLNIEIRSVVVRVPFKLTSSQTSAYVDALQARNWAGAAAVVYEAMDSDVVDAAIVEAKNDRKNVDPYGGVLVEARDRAHAAKLIRMVNESGSGVKAASTEKVGDPEYGVIVAVSTIEARGYNEAVRLGALMRPVLPGNAASRRQMLNRVVRIGQKRKSVKLATVYMDGTVLEALYKRQLEATAYNNTFDALADKYAPEQIVALMEGYKLRHATVKK